MAELSEYSRFFDTPEIVFNGKETYGVWHMPSFLINRPSEENINIFRVTSQFEGRPDRIAYNLYGSPYLDWVLIAFNEVTDVFGWPHAGDVIEYPSESLVLPAIRGR